MKIRLPIVALAVLLVAPATFAQEQYLELLRTDLKKEKVAIITEAMEFTPAEAEKFWPIYREYDLKLSKLGDRRIAAIKEYAAVYETITNEKAEELAKKFLAMDHDYLDLREEYFNKVKKAISSTVAARFMQVENQMNTLVQLQVMSELPLVKKVAKQQD
jgi:hypothetical protein